MAAAAAAVLAAVPAAQARVDDAPAARVAARRTRPPRPSAHAAAWASRAPRRRSDTDWSAAGIGAGTAFGLVPLPEVAVLVTRRLTTT